MSFPEEERRSASGDCPMGLHKDIARMNANQEEQSRRLQRIEEKLDMIVPMAAEHSQSIRIHSWAIGIILAGLVGVAFSVFTGN